MYVPPDEAVQELGDLGQMNMSFDREVSARGSVGVKVIARNPVYDNQYVITLIPI